MTPEKQKKLAKAAATILDGLCAFLDANGSEDGQRLRAAVRFIGESVPTEAVKCIERGELGGACVEVAQHVRRRRRRE